MRNSFWNKAIPCPGGLEGNDAEQMQEINEGLEEIFGTLNGQELAGDVSMLHGKHRQPDAKDRRKQKA